MVKRTVYRASCLQQGLRLKSYRLPDLLFVDSTPLNSSESGIGRFSRELRLVFRPAVTKGQPSGEKKKVIIMYKTVGDLIKALQKFPPTAQVQADNKEIQNVSVGPTGSIGGVVQISTTATT